MFPNILIIKSMSQTQKGWKLLTLISSQNIISTRDYQNGTDIWDRLLLVNIGMRVEVAAPSICKIGCNLSYEKNRSGQKQSSKIRM